MEQNKIGRVHLLDELRGAAIILMVCYHAGYDLVAIFGVDMPFFYSAQLNLIRDIMAGAFIFISGCSCRLSHSNLRRGLQTLLLAMGMTAATWLVIPEQIIRFGVLHCLGCCMLLFALLERGLDRVKPFPGALLAGVAFYLTFTLPSGVFGGLTYRFLLPRGLYDCGFLFPLGFPSPQFFSSDYYPLLPWFFLFLCGAYIGVYIREGRFPAGAYRLHCRPLAFVGRHTLWVYLCHQPILFGALSLIFYLAGRG
ncbi:MAG: DUF1624 domain-containing protein [Provencibacterium sp.]|nr:DUF1624 domain-containing protein [Provencibacterium sp.]